MEIYSCYKKLFSSDECLYCDGCFMWIHYKRSTACNKSLVKMSENCLSFFVNIVNKKCYRCKLPCKNLENY